MKYLFEEAELTCVELEKQLDLKHGDIKEIIIYPEGAVEVEVVEELSSTKQTKLKNVLKSYNLPRGKKPEME